VHRRRLLPGRAGLHDVCCGDGQVCSFQQCVVPGVECVDATECPDGNYCEYTLGEPGTMGGDLCMGGNQAGDRQVPARAAAVPRRRRARARRHRLPPAVRGDPETSFEPQLKYAWTGGDVMMPPIVIQLDDDNCDTLIDERDIPEIVFNSFEGGDYNHNGTLRAVSVKDGACLVEKWAQAGGRRIWGGRGLAGGNIDGLPGNEIVACTSPQKARAYTATGAELWVSEAVGCDQPALTDLDGDGNVEVLLEGAVLDGKTGAVELAFDAAGTSWWHKKAIAADGDADGQLEIVTASRILEVDGTVTVDTGLGGTFPAVADFDLDGKPEVAVVDNLHGTGTHWLHVWRHNPAMPGMFEVLRQNLDLNNGVLVTTYCGAMFEYGGGPPTVADFDGDGTPDVGVAGAVGYIVFSGKKLMDPNVAPADTVLWFTQTQDCSSAFTGSSVFDFDGNGKAEVVYADELYMRIYDGTTGEVLLQVCNTSGTLHEYPLVADVDNDGQAPPSRARGPGVRCRGSAQGGDGDPRAPRGADERRRAIAGREDGRHRAADCAVVALAPRLRLALRTGTYRHVPKARNGEPLPRLAAAVHHPGARRSSARHDHHAGRPTVRQQIEAHPVRGELRALRAELLVRQGDQVAPGDEGPPQPGRGCPALP
jgi:hypothetical protein